MTTFEDRKKAEEAKYRHDEEFRFKVNARRNKLLGLWAAEHFGLAADEAATYAKEVVKSDFERVGDSDVVEKVLGDFAARKIEMDEHRLRKQMERLLETAREQVATE
jgi:hypothetical protein